MTTAHADEDGMKALAAAIAANPAAAECARRLAAPGAEQIVVNVYTSREGEMITRAVLKGDWDGLLAEATWSQAYFRSHPGASALTYGDVINRRILARDAWHGRHAELQREIERRLEGEGYPSTWQFVWSEIQRMPVNDLVPFLQLNPPASSRLNPS